MTERITLTTDAEFMGELRTALAEVSLDQPWKVDRVVWLLSAHTFDSADADAAFLSYAVARLSAFEIGNVNLGDLVRWYAWPGERGDEPSAWLRACVVWGMIMSRCYSGQDTKAQDHNLGQYHGKWKCYSHHGYTQDFHGWVPDEAGAKYKPKKRGDTDALSMGVSLGKDRGQPLKWDEERACVAIPQLSPHAGSI